MITFPLMFGAPEISSLFSASLTSIFLYFRLQQAGGSDGPGHGVGVTVGGGPAVLEVALLLLAHLAGDADAGAAVGHPG